MARYLATFLFLCWFALAPIGLAQSRHHSSGTRSSKSYKSKNSNEPKTSRTVHVNGYYRKNGTYVAPYDRSTPSPRETGAASASRQSYRENYIAPGYSADPSVKRDKHGKIKRSSAAKAAFERGQPCPSTGKSSGRCPGYVVDHRMPIECGGPDAPSNMQWQTTAEAKE